VFTALSSSKKNFKIGSSANRHPEFNSGSILDSCFCRNDVCKGFTLIEVLVSVAIIIALTGFVLVVFEPEQARAKSRDATRLTQLRFIQNAIEFYYITNRTYPSSASWIAITGTDVLSTALVPNYMQSMSRDPKQDSTPVASPCTKNDAGGVPDYRYNYRSGGTFYLLTAQAEIDTSVKDYICSNLLHWSTQSGCAGSNPSCMGFENKTL